MTVTTIKPNGHAPIPDNLTIEYVKDRLNQHGVEAVLRNLGVEGFKPFGPDNWLVSAPYREDRNPSLSIRRADGVWNDKATEEAGDLVDLVKLTRGGTFTDALQFVADTAGITKPVPVKSTPGRIVDSYQYHDESGRHIYTVKRTQNKDFPVCQPDGSSGYGARRVLYHLPEILEAGDQWIILVEGEKDCDRARAEGFTATTSPGGSNGWRDEYAESLAGRRVAIVPDNDLPGLKYAHLVANSILDVADEVRLVELPALGECTEKHGKDLSDWLDDGHTVEEIKDLILSAEPYSPQDVDVDDLPKRNNLTVTTLADVERERVGWLWRGYIPSGKLTMLDGDPGLGKSTCTLDLAARTTRGRLMPDGSMNDLDQPADVILLTVEDGLGDTVRPRLEAAGADLSRVHAIVGRTNADGAADIITLPDDIAAIEEIVIEKQARLVILDPLMAFLGSGTNSFRDQDVRRALAPVAASADRTGAAWLIVRHLNKSGGTNPLYRGGGSIGIIGAARSSLLVALDPDDEDGEQRILAPTKQNLAELPPSLAFQLEPDGDVARIEWNGTSDLDATDLLGSSNRTSQGPSPAVTEAVEFLSLMLQDGPLPTRQINTEASQLGISIPSLRRARKQLNIQARRVGGAGGSGEWQLELPKEAEITLSDPKALNHLNIERLSESSDDLTPEKPHVHAENAKALNGATQVSALGTVERLSEGVERLSENGHSGGLVTVPNGTCAWCENPAEEGRRLCRDCTRE